MLLCIKRQLWHRLVIFTEVYKKLRFNLEEKEGRDQRRLVSWQSSKTRERGQGHPSGRVSGGDAGCCTVDRCVEAAAGVSRKWGWLGILEASRLN